jgi:hypothetical protein
LQERVELRPFRFGIDLEERSLDVVAGHCPRP